MSSWKRWVGIGVGGLVGVSTLLCAGTGLAGLAMPSELSLGVEEVLEAPPDALHDHLDDAEGIAAWWDLAMERYAAEHGSDPGMEVVHVAGTPTEGPGCQVDFVAGGMTAETWTILRVAPDEVVYEIDFKMMVLERTIALAPTDGGTKVSWSEQGTVGNPWIRLMAAAMGQESTKENFRGALHALDAAAAE